MWRKACWGSFPYPLPAPICKSWETSLGLGFPLCGPRVGAATSGVCGSEQMSTDKGSTESQRWCLWERRGKSDSLEQDKANLKLIPLKELFSLSLYYGLYWLPLQPWCSWQSSPVPLVTGRPQFPPVSLVVSCVNDCWSHLWYWT